MQTVYIVAIAVAGGGILGLCWIFRRRLTALTVTFRDATLKIKAKPENHATADPQILLGKGAVFEDTKVSDSKVRVSNSRLIFRKSKMNKGNLDISEPSSPSGLPDE
jgi:hypothetical protein